MAFCRTSTEASELIMEQLFQLPSIFPTDIDRQGRILIPMTLRRLMNINVGDELIWIERDSGVWLEQKDQMKR